MRHHVAANTVKNLRWKHRRLVSGHQSHPRHIPGALTIPAVAARLGVSVQWLHYRIKMGRIRPQRDPATGLWVFPDHPRTFESDTPRKAGGLMSGVASKAITRVCHYSQLSREGQNVPVPSVSASSCSRMYARTCSNSNPTVDTA